MRRPFVGIALLSGAFGALVACAATGTQESNGGPSVDPGDAGATVLGDAHAASVDATDEGFGQPQVCSPAGWCTTELPSNSLEVRDVWPVGDRAFALVYDQDLGTKVLEWDAMGGWKFIDPKVEYGVYEFPMNVWAPDENEVFVASRNLSALFGIVGGSFGGFVYHGTRPVPPETSWSWTRTQIDCEGLSFLQSGQGIPFLSGTGRDGVYTAVCGGVYRLNRDAPVDDAGLDGGSASVGERWERDYSVGDEMFGGFTAITATKTGDMWFAGVRSPFAGSENECVLLIRKSSDGYTTLIDGVPSPDTGCAAKPGAVALDGEFGDVHAPAKDVVVASLRYTTYPPTQPRPDELARVMLVEGDVQVARTSASGTFDGQLTSVWGASADDVWVIGSRLSGGGMILRATSVWDGGTFAFSTLAINGSPNTEQLFRIRGTSNQNIWAVGKNSAYLKSTP